MKFHHLPVAGGMYDQDPMLWYYWEIIWNEEYKEKEREERKRKRDSKKRSPGRR